MGGARSTLAEQTAKSFNKVKQRRERLNTGWGTECVTMYLTRMFKLLTLNYTRCLKIELNKGF